MKNRASLFLKQILSVITSLVKSKSMAIKSKTSSMKTRIIIYSLLNNKKVLMSSISHKFNSLLGQLDKQKQQQQQQQQQGVANNDDHNHDGNKAIVLYKAMMNESHPTLYELAEEAAEEEGYGHKYPDLTHTLLESDVIEEEEEEELDEEGGNQTGSVIDLMRNSKEEEGENFRLEDEIDHVADLFIRRFHRQMRMQKQESFRRYQEMLERSV